MKSFYRFPLLPWGGGGGGRLCLCEGPSTQELYKHLNLRVSKIERKISMDRRGDLLSPKGTGGGVGTASPGPPALPGRPSVATTPAHSSPRESPAWLLPTREASKHSDGCHDRKCPPAQPPQTAPPFPAAPSPRAGPAGPGSPDSRGRRNRLGRPISRPLSPALAAAPPPLSTADSKRIQKERGTLTASLGPRLCSGIRKTSAHPQSSRPKGDCPTPRKKNPKTSPGGCSGDPISQAAGARPHNNFETLG